MIVKPESFREQLKRRPAAPPLLSPVDAVVDAAAVPAMTYSLPVTSLTKTGQLLRTIDAATAAALVQTLAAELHKVKLKDDAPLFGLGPAQLVDGSYRKNGSISTVQVIAFDFDGTPQTSVDAVIEKAQGLGLACIAYPSFSHTPDAPRWRVVVPLDTGIPAAEFKCLFWAAAQALGCAGLDGFDERSEQHSRAFYLPSKPAGASNWPLPVVNAGAPISVALLRRTARPQVDAEPARVEPTQVHRLGDGEPDADFGLIKQHCAAAKAFAEGPRLTEPDWRNMVGVLRDVRDGQTLYHQLSAQDQRYNPAETQRKWDGWNATGPATCGTFSHCPTCPTRGKVSTPVQLGRQVRPGEAKADAAQALAAALTAAGIELVMSTDGALMCVQRACRDGRAVVSAWRAVSEAALDAIISACMAASSRFPSQQQIDAALAQARASARKFGNSVPFSLRVAENDGALWLDLGAGRLARVDEVGVSLVDDAALGAPIFVRGTGAGELPDPTLPASPGEGLRVVLRYLQQTFGLDSQQGLLLTAAIMEWMRPGTPHPVLSVFGGAGSGKSMFAEFVVSLIDPCNVGRTTVSTDGRDLAAAAQQRHVLMIDNASRLDRDTSDLLCIMSTGGVRQERQLYTNGEMAQLRLHKGVVITSVSPVVVATDLQTRTLQIEIKPRQTRRSEDEMRAEFADKRPYLIGALLSLLSVSLRGLPPVKAARVGSQRMVDFEQLGEAMVREVGLTQGHFSQALGHMMAGMVRRSISGDGFMLSLCDALRKITATAGTATKPTARGVVDSPAKICNGVSEDGSVWVMARPEAMRQKLARRDGAILPGTGRAFSDALRRVQPMLATIGVGYAERTSGTRTVICFDFLPGAICE